MTAILCKFFFFFEVFFFFYLQKYTPWESIGKHKRGEGSFRKNRQVDIMRCGASCLVWRCAPTKLLFLYRGAKMFTGFESRPHRRRCTGRFKKIKYRRRRIWGRRKMLSYDLEPLCPPHVYIYKTARLSFFPPLFLCISFSLSFFQFFFLSLSISFYFPLSSFSFSSFIFLLLFSHVHISLSFVVTNCTMLFETSLNSWANRPRFFSPSLPL